MRHKTNIILPAVCRDRKAEIYTIVAIIMIAGIVAMGFVLHTLEN